MATSDQFKYSTDESVKSKYVCCSMCSDDRSYTASRYYCVDCEMYFCTKCVKCHNKIPASKSHHVNAVDTCDTTNPDDEAEERRTESSDTLKCTLHQGKFIDTYCKNHDEVCCGTCAIVKHRLCTTESMATAATNFNSNPDVNKSKESLTTFLIRLKQEKEKRTENIDYIGKQKLELIETVDKYEEKIIAKIKKLANITRKEIRSKYEKYKTALDNDVSALDAVMTATTVYVDKLEHTGNEALLFANIKISKIVSRDGEMLLQDMVAEWTEKTIALHFDKTLEKTVDEIKSFCRFEGDLAVKVYHATFLKNVNVKQSNDARDTCVTHVCVMESSDFLLTDYSNNKLKRFNSDLHYKDEIPLAGNPIAVCTIDKHKVAVRIWSTQAVHIISIGKSMQLTSSFTLAGNGYGMTYDASTGEILACEENKVSAYSKTGHKIRTYDKDTNGEQMFSSCRQIALSVNKQDIYVTDQTKGLIVLDKSGKLKMKVAFTSDTWPLCPLPGHISLAGSCSSGEIVQIDKDGKNVGNLIGTNDGRTYTYCAVYDREHSRLIVGGSPSVMSIYTISAK